MSTQLRSQLIYSSALEDCRIRLYEDDYLGSNIM